MKNAIKTEAIILFTVISQIVALSCVYITVTTKKLLVKGQIINARVLLNQFNFSHIQNMVKVLYDP